MNRYLHYGVKFWFGTSAVMALILALSAEVPTIQTWRPLYLILTVIIVCSQKVDTTLSKGVLRFVASVVGGAYGKVLLPLLALAYAQHGTSPPAQGFCCVTKFTGRMVGCCCPGLPLSMCNFGKGSLAEWRH